MDSNNQSMFSRIVYGALSAIAIVYITGQIFAFIGVGFDVYGIYVLFTVAIALMYAFLPQDVGGMFN